MNDFDIDAAERQAIRNGDCPDCGEKIASSNCCSYSEPASK